MRIFFFNRIFIGSRVGSDFCLLFQFSPQGGRKELCPECSEGKAGTAYANVNVVVGGDAPGKIEWIGYIGGSVLFVR